MDSSSDDDSGFVRRKASKKKILESDDENDDNSREEKPDDFKLHLSDEDEDSESIEAKIAASLANLSEDSTGSSVRSPRLNVGCSPESKPQNCSLDSSAADSHTHPLATSGNKTKTTCFEEADVIRMKLSALADSDSESDNDTSSSQHRTPVDSTTDTLKSDSGDEGNSDHNGNNPIDFANSSKIKKGKCGPSRKSKAKAKDAMLEIKAESQRQLRESRIGLPYHVPKQRSLLDFLNRRKSSSPMPIKGPVELLAPVWKQIEDREKEVELFYKSESENESDIEESNSCSSSTKQHDSEVHPGTSILPNMEKPGLQGDSSDTTDGKYSVNSLNNIVATEEEHTTLLSVSTTTLKSSDGDMESEIDSPSIENHFGVKSGNAIKESSVDQLTTEDRQTIHVAALLNSVNEKSSREIELLETTEGNSRTSNKQNFNPTGLDVENHGNNFLKDNDQSRAQQNKDCLRNSVDHGEKLPAHSPNPQGTSLLPIETKTKVETSHSIEEKGNISEVFGHEEDEIRKADKPSKFCLKVALAENSCDSPQDSQDINLHYSETQGHVNGCETQAITHEDEASCENKGVGEQKNSNTGPYSWVELDAAIRNDEHSDSEDIPKREANKQAVSSGPRLSLKGDPNDIIDLDDMSSKPSTGVKSLIERFMKHSTSKKKPSLARTVELRVISSDKDSLGDVTDLKQESVKIHLNGDDNCRVDSNLTPGARLKLLKNELNNQMRKLKEEEWQKKLEEMKNEKYFSGEKDVCDGLADEYEDEEEEMTDSEGESEPEINDIREPKKKKKVKSMFVDEEAEVDNEGNGSDPDEETQDNGIDGDDEEDEEEEDEGDSDARGIEDDGDRGDNEYSSDEDKSMCDSIKNTESKSMSGNISDEFVVLKDQEETSGSLQRTMTSTSDLFASQSNEYEDDDFIPPGQPNGVVRSDELTQESDEPKDCSLFLSPCLTNPAKRLSFMETNNELTPLKRSGPIEKTSPSIKQLFSETQPESTQDKLAELACLFGDKFKDSQEDVPAFTNTSTNSESEVDLMALCSGKFVTQVPNPKELEEECTQPFISSGSQFPSQMSSADECPTAPQDADDSVDFCLKWDGDAKSSEDAKDSCMDTKEQFRLEIMSSDEEDTTVHTSNKKKKIQRLQYSDDEEDVQENNDLESLVSDQSDMNDEEEAANHGNAKLFDLFNKPSKEVLYDSDENEIEAADFLEKEAELSEEEDWRGSEDEDEKGLDQLEMDEADKEDIDQDKVREQLVKNHMQKMLDEDRRDVRILQEMLLEDGELHSDTGGRERQFRWRNVDSTGMGDNEQLSDDEHADQEEDEDDAEWRKQRHEREMFLKEQQEKQKKGTENHEENDEVLENSELLQLGKSVLFKSRPSSLDMSFEKDHKPIKFPVPNPLFSPDGKKSSGFLSKRGSFLSRGDTVLAKLAKFTGSVKENVLAGAKTSGNFVFSSKSPSKRESQSEEDLDPKSSKRKAVVGLLNPTEKKQCLVVPSKKKIGLFDHL